MIYITTRGKKDGVGSQVLSKILAILFCKKNHYNYIHTPLQELDYRDQDETGKKAYQSGNGKEWVNKWENFLNIGKLFYRIEDIKYDRKIDLTDVSKNGQITMNDGYLWHDFDPLPLIKKYSEQYPEDKILFIVKEFPKMDKYEPELQREVMERLRKHYWETPKNKVLSGYDHNMVIHKRHTRGNKLKPNTNLNNVNNRVTLNSFYIDLLIKVNQNIVKSYGPTLEILKKKYRDSFCNNNRFIIVSDGCKADFPELNFKNDIHAEILNTEDKTLDNQNIKLDMKLKTDSMEAFHYMVTANVLILDKSSFGYLAGLYNTGEVYYNPYWDKKYCDWKDVSEI